MASLQFLNPEFLVLLLAVPLLAITHYYFFRFTKKKGMVFANFQTLQRVTGKRVLTRNFIVLLFRVLVLSALILALAEPTIWYQGQEQNSDYVLAIDTSASMTATDISPNRLDAAKLAGERFIDQLNSSAEIGVIGFSGVVQVEQTLTSDLIAAKQAIQRLEVRTISGTDIGGALVMGTNLLQGSSRGRVLILITDGSATAGTFNEDPVGKGVAYARDHEVVVHTIGIGSEGGGASGYLPRLYNVSAAYNQETLNYIANQTGGRHMTARDDVALSAAYAELTEKSGSTIHVQPLNFGLLLVALLLLFLEWGLTNTRYRIIP